VDKCKNVKVEEEDWMKLKEFFLKLKLLQFVIYIFKNATPKDLLSLVHGRLWGHSRQIGWGFVEKGWERVSKREILRRRWLSCGREAQLPP
jgi:hypothetical protein